MAILRPGRTLRFAVFSALFLFFLCCFLFSGSPAHSPLRIRLSPQQQQPLAAPVKNTTHPRPSPWCTPSECGAGRWVPRTPLFASPADFRAAYANRQDGTWKGCRAIPNPARGKLNDDEQRVADEERLMHVMNWEWQPDKGNMRAWDAEEFAVRLLRSPGGLILMGDSITQQHEHSIGYLLRQAGLEFDTDPPHLPLHTHKNVHQLVLKPSSPLTQRLQARAGVPASRLRWPLVTLLEEHMLIHEPDIRRITERLGGSKDHFWYHDFQRVEDWPAYIRNASAPREGEEDTVTEDTILLLNAGAHWSRHELSMLPDRTTDAEEQARVKEAYRGMIKLVTAHLAPIPQLSVVYRSTSPAHPLCGVVDPYPNARAARHSERAPVARLQAQVDTDDLKRQRRRWDWDLFVPHNELWRGAVGRLSRAREDEVRARTGAATTMTGVRAPGARWFYLDIWDLSLQRVDAHSEPGVDCLHWCMPSVLNVWTHQLHHMLFLQAEERRAQRNDGELVNSM
ncbi:hypothetical protein BD779DRAFT_1676738 [Infundibulicybe gibba]|nr:hypothetical protein BD779DRAFT_1676738 [Infundibulicybe gibba]